MRALPPAGRRALLLASAGLLGGCEWLDDLLGERKVPLSGERRSVLGAAERRGGLAADEALLSRPVSLPPPALNPDWPQAGGGPSHAPGHPALEGDGGALREVWRAGFGTGSGYRSRITGVPIVAGGTAYAVDAVGVVSAFDAATGGRRWRLDSRPEQERDGAVGGGAAFEGDTLYVASGLAEMLAVAPADGTVRWRTRLPAPTRGAPTVAGGRIFVPTIENQLLALSAEDGRRLWTHRASPATAVPLGLPAPAVEGDIVVAGFASGELSALRAADGRVLWTETLAPAGGSSLAEIAGIRALPVVDRGRVYAIGMGGLAIAIDLRSGRRLWEREVAGTEAPWSVGEWLFLLTSDGELAALGREDGRVRWVTDLRRPREGRREPPRVYWAAPVLAGGRLYVAGSGGELVAVEPAEGRILERRRLPGGVTLQPAVAGGTLYLATDDATLVALRGTASA
ncbi:outer membrane protein assembly factor BamB family protein [Caldovatus aquaticus]|uniref:PQQ-binding-like beta-propeller repeat protein n=1 Tax=Caldovatus aquaticus TaxID=2865671 RepID=A0ABS7F5C3_9PROT|nr:PQQ-binding-like beta-propeller repeat protein [Caldovatus aquaticus]MBW8270830.1 PQQ-binding-like beta-propeller repeat protein [Caldovatus aquaticus]